MSITTFPERTRFRDVKPYFAPASLDQLQGPYSGEVELRHSVRWVGDGRVNIDTGGGVKMAYQALLTNGLVTDQIKGLNARRLIEVWPDLDLDQRIRDLWESRFPQLAQKGEAWKTIEKSSAT